MDPAATNIGYWSNIGSTAQTRTLDTTVFHSGTSAVRTTATAAGPLGTKAVISGGITSGDTVSWSIWVYSSVAIQINPYWERTAPTYTGGSSAPLNIAVAANTWTQIKSSVAFNVNQADPAGNFGFGVFSASAYAIGDFLICDEVVIEKVSLAQLGPYFDGSTPLTNLISNTRGVNAYSDYTGAVNQTITANVTVAGNPDGITTANRVSYAGGATSPGVTFINPAVVGTQYTISAWVYHESVPAAGTQGFAQAGVVSQASPPAIVQGTWQRISWTYTATTTNQIGFRVSAPTTAGSFLITGILVERSGTLSAFYEGQGDFTYSWIGGTNASASIQRGVGLANWGGAGSAITFQSSFGVWAGTKRCGVQTTGRDGDGVFSSQIAVTPNLVYTSSAYIKATATQLLTASIRFLDSGLASIGADVAAEVGGTLTVGQWTRVSVTATAPANAAYMLLMFRVYGAGNPPTVFYVDGSLAEAWPNLQPYFDGSTAAAGDYTYNWNATVNASTSVQRAVMVPNTSASRNSGAGYENSKFFVYQSTAEDGKKTSKWFTPAGSSNSQWRVSAINAGGSGWTYAPVKTGGRYTLMMRYRSSGWGSGQGFQIMIADGGSQNQVINYDVTQTLNQTGWQEYRRTFTALMDATSNSCLYMAFPTIPQTSTDGIFEIREWMLVEGEYTGDYIDGTKPLSKWDGTANASTSVGYPPQLTDFAGKPLLDYSTAGTYTLDDSFGAQEGRTFYTVFENYTDLSALSPIVQYGDAALSDVVPNTYIQLRQDPYAGAGNQMFQRRTGAQGNTSFGVTNARHVVCWGINNSGVLNMAVDGGALNTDPTAVSMSLPHQKILIQSDDSLHKHFRTIMYRGIHDTATRTAISRYLGTKYGANVA
jgi:hypothetical protein